jgi:hypothetical protein
MKTSYFILILALGIGSALSSISEKLRAQEAKPSADAAAKPAPAAPVQPDAKAVPAYSGMYSFLKEGEFVQVTVEDTGHVTGFVSRFGDEENNKEEFLDQFFKTAKLDGNKLSFTTEMVNGVTFDFKGTVERGEGKNPGDEAYFVLNGTLTQSATDANKKVTSHSQEVAFKVFPQDAASPPAAKK